MSAPVGAGMRLAIVAPAGVAEFVRATPVFLAAARSPRFEPVSILCREELAPLLADGPLAELVQAHGAQVTEKQLLAQLRPDAVLLLGDDPESARHAQELGVPVRVGAATLSRLRTLTHAVVPAFVRGGPLPVPVGHRYRDLAGLLGLHPTSLAPRLGLSPGGAAEVRAVLERRGLAADTGYVLCSPGAGAAGEWPLERFSELLQALHARHGWGAVVVSESDRPAALDVPGPGATWTPADGGPALLRSLCAGAELVVAAEGDVRWVASAFDVPRVSILSLAGRASALRPDGRGEVLCPEEAECSEHRLRERTLGHGPGSSELRVEQVLAAVDTLLESAREALPSIP